ncbi:alpha/beta hydrolase [Parashewanella spongiae]|uniref:Alpha/beta hydrolase n=1 Tax=Parashewanella spongiae TaxID=342950 RepID=A0A3A6TQK9_9GAMM|nr:alpha/beta hydrolase YcfP [Parashewanella spongiae]MCL1077551.1 alpha/beta hydrolase YcfP [Parashewanella spongiae]RJY18291.1 alpha/beta hydrolase [Parashewanella spongiae]
MILYLHGFDATSLGNHEKMRQLQFIDDDVRLLSYSTQHPKNDMQYLLNEVVKQIKLSDDKSPLIIGVGLGAYWAERIGFLTGLRSVLINPNLRPELTMNGRIDRPEEYADIANKCVHEFRSKNKAMCILSRHDEVMDNLQSYDVLSDYYDIIWDEHQSHKFSALGVHLPVIKSFKDQG